jgi:hypothetical protein
VVDQRGDHDPWHRATLVDADDPRAFDDRVEDIEKPLHEACVGRAHLVTRIEQPLDLEAVHQRHREARGQRRIEIPGY